MTSALKKVPERQAKPPGRIARFFKPVLEGLLNVAEGGAGVLALIGAPVAAFLGKLFLAAILMGIVAGVWLRFTHRRMQPVALPMAAPRWSTLAVGALSAIEVALLVEATHLAVRTDQPNFQQSNWLWVLLAWGVAFFVQRGWIRQWFSRRQTGLPAVQD